MKTLDEEAKVGDRQVLVGKAKSRVISQLDVLDIYHNNFHEWMKDEYESHEVFCAQILPTPAYSSLDDGTQIIHFAFNVRILNDPIFYDINVQLIFYPLC